MDIITDQKTILFVDDEKNILSSLRRLMRREPWVTLFANSAEEGLQIMAKQKVDLVVTDMRMPNMDGAAFLQCVQAQYPDTLRVILTGDADRDTVIALLQNECAHQMMMKPWDADELKSLLKNLMGRAGACPETDQGVSDSFVDVTSLPTLPQVYLDIKDVLSQADHLSTKKIGEVVEQDPSVSVRLLKWANSAIFGQRKHVDHIQRAIVVLGIEIVQGLVLSMSVFDLLDSGSEEPAGYSRSNFWKHSLACGLASRWLCKEMGLSDVVADKAFAGGLLHDLGKLYEDCYHHQRFVETVAYAKSQRLLLRDAEKKIMGLTHMETGAHLAEWWDLSPSLAQVIRWHHSPQMAVGSDQIVGVVHVANALMHQFNYGTSGNFARPKLDAKTWKQFELDKTQVQTLKNYIQQMQA